MWRTRDPPPRAHAARVWAPPGLVFGLLLALYPQVSSSDTATPLYSERPVVASLLANETKCYHFSLDADTTRNVVYWKQAKLHLRLEPCAGTPHMRASVYGCPSQGHLTNWEYQSDRARNDLRAKGQPVPADWEWPGDLESLSIDVTHRHFYVEISQYQPPLRTNASLYDLENRLRAKGFLDQADRVVETYSEGRLTNGGLADIQAQVNILRGFQQLLMPEATYILTATLHDAAVVPADKVYPLTNAPGWDRTISHVSGGEITVTEGAGGDAAVDPAASGAYLIAFWPPTRQANASVNATAGNSTAAAPTPAVATARRLLEQASAGVGLTWGDVEAHVAEQHGEVPHTAARRALAMEDVVFSGANPASGFSSPGAAGAGPEPWEEYARGGATAGEGTRRREEERRRAAEETDRQLAELRAKAGGGLDEHVEKGRQRLAEARRRAAGLAPGSGEAVTVRQAVAQQGRTGIIERANEPIVDAELEYMLFWTEVTAQFRERFGVMTDSLGTEYTRLLDNPCGDSDDKCGIKQWATKSEFSKLDRDQDGVLTRAEYEEQYTAARAAYDTGFTGQRTFDAVAGNSSSATLSLEQWMLEFGGAQAIIDSTVKDPLSLTFWTVCSVNGTGSRIVPSGNASKDQTRAVWEPWTQFGQRAGDGRLTRSVMGLNDNDNNIYILNILVRHRRTGEYASYKPHVIQRKTPLYTPKEMDSTDYNMIIGVCTAFGVITAILLFALLFTRNKRLRPKLVIKRPGKAAKPALAGAAVGT